jgi:hypothetical protein
MAAAAADAVVVTDRAAAELPSVFHLVVAHPPSRKRAARLRAGVLPADGRGNEAAVPDDPTTGHPDVDIDKGEGATPAMNRPGPEADDDRAVTPGNLGWDTPSDEEPESIGGAVRRGGDQDGEPAALPSDARGATGPQAQ